MEYIKKWDNSNWLESAQALENDTKAFVKCGFVNEYDDQMGDDMETDDEESDDEESDEEESDNEESSTRTQKLREVITETEIEDGGREFSLEVGGLLPKLINVTTKSSQNIQIAAE